MTMSATARALVRSPAPRGATMTGGQAIWQALERLGVSHAFGYPGGAILPTYDALASTSVRHVLVRHEQSAAHMADGFARATGRPGVAIATSGPGATNLLTGIATAMADSSPVVCITGQVSSHVLGTDAFQEVDITGMAMPVTKHTWLVTDGARIVPTLRDAFRVATEGRPGPVLVDITKDAQQALVDFTWDPRPDPPPPERGARRPGGGDPIDDALDLIAGARRPVILAGHGVILAGASRALRAFAERAQIPVAHTLLGIGSLPASHPLHLGMVGMHGESWVNVAVQESDLLIALGMRFDDRAVGRPGGYAPRARRIQVDIDASEINKTVRVDVGIVADLATPLRRWIPRVPAVDRGDWLGQIETWRRAARPRDIQHLPNDGRLHGAHVVAELCRQTRGRAVVVSDVGQHQMWEAQYYRHERPRSLITSGGLGTMGFALPAAIGAKLARPAAEVWVVAGDGGFQMTGAELATVAQEGIPLRIAVINNRSLGMVRQWQELFYEKRYPATSLGGPDFCALAGAYGIPAFAVDEQAGIAPAIRAARRTAGPVLVEFRVEREDLVYPMVPSGASLHDMLRRPAPGIVRMTARARKPQR
jgi:acetolactate synthase I/II/III large subunit